MFLDAARILATAGDRAEASVSIQRAEAELRAIESAKTRSRVGSSLAEALRLNGNAKAAVDQARGSLEATARLEEKDAATATADALLELAAAHKAAGERDLALADLREAERAAGKCEYYSVMSYLLRTAGAYKDLGDEAAFQACLDSATDKIGDQKEVEWRRSLGETFALYCMEMGWMPSLIEAFRSPKFGKPRAYLVNTVLEEALHAPEENRTKLLEYMAVQFPDDDKRFGFAMRRTKTTILMRMRTGSRTLSGRPSSA